MLTKVLAYIEERYAEPISLTEGAATADLSPATSLRRSGNVRAAPWRGGSPNEGMPRRGGCWSRLTRAWRTSAPSSATTTPHTPPAAAAEHLRGEPLPHGGAPTGLCKLLVARKSATRAC